MSGAAGTCSACAAATRCSAAASPIPTASKGRPARPQGSACSTSRPCWRRQDDHAGRRRGMRDRRCRCAATRCISAAPTAPDCARPDAAISAAGRTARSRADGRVPGTYLHGLFASDAFRRAFLADFGAASHAGLRGARSRRRSTRSPTISSGISISTRLLAIAAQPSERERQRRAERGEQQRRPRTSSAAPGRCRRASRRRRAAGIEPRVVDDCARRSGAARPARGRARRPSPLSGQPALGERCAGAHRAASPQRAPAIAPRATGAASAISSADRRAGIRFSEIVEAAPPPSRTPVARACDGRSWCRRC